MLEPFLAYFISESPQANRNDKKKVRRYVRFIKLIVNLGSKESFEALTIKLL